MSLDPSIEDVLTNPRKFGLPTFQDFASNPDRYREHWFGKSDELFGYIDKGSEILNRYFSKVRFKFKNYECDSLERVESVAKDEGLTIKELEFRPELIPQGGGKCELLAQFWPKITEKIIQTP